jgi:putative ABC transport system permease protein
MGDHTMNNQIFYAKLAVTNLRKNKETYIPYMIACIGCIFIYFLFISLINNPGMTNIPNSDSLKVLFGIGKNVSMIFVSVFIFYANSFLMKRRTKEIALYGILGLEKRHIAKIMFFETLLVAMISLIAGVLISSLLGKLFFLLLLKFIKLQGEASYQITGFAIMDTFRLFGIIFLVTFLWNYINVKMSNSITLLKSEESGEKEPKASIFITIAGFLCLGIGYYLAINTKSITSSVFMFFIAVVFVVAGVYALFTSGSIAFLKALKKRKTFYYQPKYFISISNMMYRMKKNAVGLASISLLSTMIVITIGSTVVLYSERNEMLRAQNPYDIGIEVPKGSTTGEELIKMSSDTAKKHSLKVTKSGTADIGRGMSICTSEGVFISTEEALKEGEVLLTAGEKITSMYFLSLEEYNRLANQQITLEDQEVLIQARKTYDMDKIQLFDKEYQIKSKIDSIPFLTEITSMEPDLFGGQFLTIVFANEELVEENIRNISGNTTSEAEQDTIGDTYSTIMGVNISGNTQEQISYSQELESLLSKETSGGFMFSSYARGIESWNQLYGGILYLGVFLGLLFICAFVLIIYFKQVSEGYEDRGRFNILEKVGMDKREVKKTIYSQIKLVFILPIAFALLNVAMAQPILQKLLVLFGVTNKLHISLGMGIISLIFLLLYIIVYLFTARIYNRIVSNK